MTRSVIAIFIVVFLLHTALAETEKPRPKIGLVLGGGGALGFAHVGVLQVLEELRIPVDYIGGTSMGAIVAGMYASGMTPQEMEQQFLSIDWWDVLKDRSSHEFLAYRRKVENKRYMGAEFGFNNGQFSFSPGMSYGQKLNNLLSTFAINSAGIRDFDHLNIPYRAVATDLRSGTSVVLKQGDLARAMRASMAVPGAFTPVRMNGMVLVDGGILDNIPVDVVKEMGADIIIAVDVGASFEAKSKNSDFNGLGDVVGRTYMIMQRPNQETQLSHADLIIAPDLAKNSASQFHRAGDIIPRGTSAAEALKEQLVAYSVDEETYAAFLAKQRHINNGKIEVTSIQVNGNGTVSEQSIHNRIRSKPGPLKLSTVYDDLNRIHGMGYFQTATYELEPEDSGFALNFNTTEKFWGPAYLHVGMNLETSSGNSMLWSLLLNYTRTRINSLGGEIRIDLEGGGSIRSMQAEWYQPIVPSERLFIAPSILMSDEDIDFYWGEDVVADVEQRLAYGMLDAGISGFEYGELRIGILGGYAEDSGNSGFLPLDTDADSVVAATTHLRLDQLNDPVFPTTGYQLWLDGIFADEQVGSSETFEKLEGRIMVPLTLGNHTLLPKVSAGSSLGTELPFYALFEQGGVDGFAGYAPYQFYGNYYGIASLTYRYQIAKLPPTVGKGVYSLLRFDTGNAWLDRSDVAWDNITHGGLIGLSADTLLGTCTIAVGKAEGLNPRFYFSIGNTF